MEWKQYILEELINPNTVMGAVFLALGALIVASVVCMVTTRMIRHSIRMMGRLKRRVDETVVTYLIRIKNILIFLVTGMLYASLVPGLRTLLGTIMASAGITALIVGFAAKSTLANFISGLSLAVYRPIRIGDKVTIDNEYCTVEDITLRHTIVRSWENKRLIIPNEKLDNMTIVNHSIVDPKIMCRVEFGVSYDTDIDLARRLILEEAGSCPHIAKDSEEPRVKVISHGDFSIGLRLYVWVPNMDESFAAKFWMLEQVKKRFDREGVEIPFPYRTLVYKKDLPPAPKDVHYVDQQE
jgi:small-conductance mechanosensitive channel